MTTQEHQQRFASVLEKPHVFQQPVRHAPLARDVAEAVKIVRDRFPFERYMDAVLPACRSIARALERHLPPGTGARILDFGCGPCEKTAVLSALGYRCAGLDDLGDEWHNLPGKREKILGFMAQMNIDFRLAAGDEFPWPPQTFDVVMLNDVLEHLHNSPRTLLTGLLSLVKDEGLLLITVPSAVNIRKRIDVLFGRTNHAAYATYYWHPDPWRGHIREYTKGDLALLADYLGLTTLELHSCDFMLKVLPNKLRSAYLAATALAPGWKDTWLLLAKKPKGWKPKEPTAAEMEAIWQRIGGSYH
jgi:SAM-dependent methyltransferase